MSGVCEGIRHSLEVEDRCMEGVMKIVEVERYGLHAEDRGVRGGTEDGWRTKDVVEMERTGENEKEGGKMENLFSWADSEFTAFDQKQRCR